jgi:hypothetical protein
MCTGCSAARAARGYDLAWIVSWEKRAWVAKGAFTARSKADSHAENAESFYIESSVPTGVFRHLEAALPEIALPLLVNAPVADQGVQVGGPSLRRIKERPPYP